MNTLLDHVVLRDYINRVEVRSEEWRRFLVENELTGEQRVLVLETLGLLSISKDICYCILEKGDSPDMGAFSARLIKVVELLLRVYQVVEDKVNVDTLPDWLF